MRRGLPWVALGGALGALSRWLLAQVLPATTTFTFVDLPWGTFLANILGCLVLGTLTGVIDVRPLRPPQLQLVIGVGFCGGFTTMSTFALELATMLGASYPLEAFQYAVSALVFALGAVMGGFLLGRLAMKRYLERTESQNADQIPDWDDFTDVPSNDIVVGAVGIDDAGEKK